MRKPFSKHVGVRPFSGRVFTEKRGGRWVVRYEWAPGGKRKARTLGPDSPAAREEAERLLTTALGRLAESTSAAPPALTFGELLRTYREAAATRRSRRTGQPLRPTTLQNYADYHRTLRDAFAPDRAAGSLRRAEILKLVDRLQAQGWAEGTIARLVDHLHQVYRWALLRELVEQNPVEGVERGSRKGAGKAYTEDEAARLLAALETRSHGDWRFRVVMLLEAAYGVRASQATQLRWEDVDFDAAPTPDAPGTVTFRQAGEGSKGQPDRTMPMLPPVRVALLEAYGHKDVSPWVTWNWRDGTKPVTYDGMLRALHRLEHRAHVRTIPGRGFHACRRALATALTRQLGIPAAAAWLADTVKVIADSYVHPDERDRAEAAQAVAVRLGKTA